MIGIIGAMEEEVAELKKDMQIEETVEMAGMVFCKGTLGGKDVVIVRSGIGKVNAGICAQILVSQFGADTLINTGIAGSLDAQIDIGDMVISTDALHHDMDATVFGDPAGQIPRMDTLSFPADKELVKKAVAANEKANPDIHTFTGRVASGDQFISDKEVKERIVSLFHPMCVEMEGAASIPNAAPVMTIYGAEVCRIPVAGCTSFVFVNVRSVFSDSISESSFLPLSSFCSSSSETFFVICTS